ncbi:MAG: hypothetical protein MK135_14900, partial [Polyangiaceae bacterium]|nr:hypothetical protein [Polyangiaceae bacterium]
ESLLDNIDSDRLEIDLIHFKGPYFAEVDNRLMNLHLVRSWCCRAVMFDTEGASIVPSSAMRKKDVMVMRGSFNPPTKVHLDMTNAAIAELEKIGGLSGRGILNVAEITMSELASDGEKDDASFLARVDLLVSLGYNVLISDYLRFFRLRSWIRNFTKNRIAVILSVHDLDKIFDDSFYEGLEGGILVALGQLFSDDTKVFVYPSKVEGELVTLENAKIPEKERYLLQHLVLNQRVIALEDYHEEHLHISPPQVSEKIAQGPGDWEDQVPASVVEAIVKSRLFGFPG